MEFLDWRVEFSRLFLALCSELVSQVSPKGYGGQLRLQSQLCLVVPGHYHRSSLQKIHPVIANHASRTRHFSATRRITLGIHRDDENYYGDEFEEEEEEGEEEDEPLEPFDEEEEGMDDETYMRMREKEYGDDDEEYEDYDDYDRRDRGDREGRYEDDEDGERDGEEGEDDDDDDSDSLNPLEVYAREEFYPGLSEEVIEKLHFPENGLPEDAFLDDLPILPNPYDHSMDPDTETDPSKIREKPYDFNGANVHIETREAIVPTTWENEILGPPGENRRVRLTVKVRDLKLPVYASQKLVLMAGPRYNFNNDVLTLTSDRYESRKQNGRYLLDLLESLVEEAQKETEIAQKPRRLPKKRGKFTPFNKTLLGSGMVKKQYEGMITEDE